MENNFTEKQEVKPATRKISASAQIFGHFTKREFWIELLEGIVKASVTAFFIAVGDALIKYGKRRGGAETPDIYDIRPQQPSPATQAFSRGYSPPPSQGYGSLNNPPAPISQEGVWPGFGAR